MVAELPARDLMRRLAWPYHAVVVPGSAAPESRLIPCGPSVVPACRPLRDPEGPSVSLTQVIAAGPGLFQCDQPVSTFPGRSDSAVEGCVKVCPLLASWDGHCGVGLTFLFFWASFANLSIDVVFLWPWSIYLLSASYVTRCWDKNSERWAWFLSPET